MQPHIQEMLEQAEKTLANAHVPYSDFPVAACLLTADKHLYSGCNYENASYSLTVCAETAAIAAMVSAGEQRIAEIVVIAKKKLICPPCGACRQRLAEFSTPGTLIHLCGDGQLQKTFTMAELLPESFKL